MPKPMYCPMSFNQDIICDGVYCQPKPMECTPDCAWAVVDLHDNTYGCGMIEINLLGSYANRRILKEDNNEH